MISETAADDRRPDDDDADPERPAIRQCGADDERTRNRSDNPRPPCLVSREPFTEQQERQAHHERGWEAMLHPQPHQARQHHDDRDARFDVPMTRPDHDQRHPGRSDHQRGPECRIVDHVLDIVHGP